MHKAERADWMLPVEAINESSVNTTEDVSHRYCHYTGNLRDQDMYIAEQEKEFVRMKGFSVIRRVKRCEVTDGTHVRMRAIASEEGDRVCWMKVDDQNGRHDVDAGTHALKVFHTSIAGAASLAQSTDIARSLQSWTPLLNFFTRWQQSQTRRS